MSKSDSKNLLKLRQVRCSQCNKLEFVEITRDLIEQSQGGLSRIGVMHTCQDEEQNLLVLYVDRNCAIRTTSLFPILQQRKKGMEKGKTYFIGALSKEETMKREKDAFILDKTILKVICEEGPLSLDDIKHYTIELEPVLGIRIDPSLIEKIISKYIERGLVEKINY